MKDVNFAVMAQAMPGKHGKSRKKVAWKKVLGQSCVTSSTPHMKFNFFLWTNQEAPEIGVFQKFFLLNWILIFFVLSGRQKPDSELKEKPYLFERRKTSFFFLQGETNCQAELLIFFVVGPEESCTLYGTLPWEKKKS